MAWKCATGFGLTAETWLGTERTRSGEEAVLTIGVSHHERMAVIRRIRRTPALAFGPAEWLPADALDMLSAVLAEDGELRAHPGGTSTWSSKSCSRSERLAQPGRSGQSLLWSSAFHSFQKRWKQSRRRSINPGYV